MPVQSFRVTKKPPNKLLSALRYHAEMRFSRIHTRNIGIKRRFTRRPECTEFCDRFSSSQEGHFTSLDRFKRHHCRAIWQNEPSFYPGKKWISGNLKSFNRNYTLLFAYGCPSGILWRYIMQSKVWIQTVWLRRTPVQNASFPVTVDMAASYSQLLTIFNGQIAIKCYVSRPAACIVFLGNIIQQSASEINIV